MPVTAKMRKALDPKKFRRPPGFGVTKLDIEDYTDWDGDEALKVRVLLDESFDPEKVGGQAISDFKRAIRDALRKQDVTVWVYFSFAKPSELADTDED